MDALARIMMGGDVRAEYGPAHDFWYRDAGSGPMTVAGLRVDAEGAKKISAWFRGRNILATALAMLPLHLYERLPDDQGSNIARQNRLYDVLHRKPDPNGSGDSFTWRVQGMFDLIDEGWAYDWIGVGEQWSLRRIDPKLVTPETIKRGPNTGRYLFHVRDEVTGHTTVHTQDEIFYRRAPDGKGILSYARDSLGLARVTEAFAANVFGSGSLNAGLIEVPGPMDPESARAMALSFKTSVGDWHLPRILPNGAKFHKDDGLTPDKAQMLLSRKFSINDIARWLGLPPHMLGDLDRATFSNIEHQGQEFVTYFLGPWLSLWEFAINDQLVLQPGRFYAEFTRDALARGDITTRWQAHLDAVNAGIKTVDEVRRVEGLNKRGGKADELREPQNITGKPLAPSSRRKARDDEDDEARARGAAIVEASAARILRTEVAAVQKAAVRHADNSEAFAVAVSEFYASHAGYVAKTLLLPLDRAKAYCAGQCSQALADNWPDAVETWQEPWYAAGLAAIALEVAA